MSLNIDLYAAICLDGHEKSPPAHRDKFAKVIDLVGLAPFTPVDSIPYVSVKLHVADWSHAYNLWQWFAEHGETGEASFEETRISREDLQQLLEICQRLLVRRNRKEAQAALPLPPGQFKRKKEEDEYWREYFWPHVEMTVQQLGPILTNPKFTKAWEFRYKFG